VTLKDPQAPHTATSLKNVKLQSGEVLTDVDVLLWCIGRSPNVEGLQLEKAGVNLS
jgi:pyruvate/2-oxoglutarate dehydrogenase complex dihydrolipoamide dehydrogenase (E3) component